MLASCISFRTMLIKQGKKIKRVVSHFICQIKQKSMQHMLMNVSERLTDKEDSVSFSVVVQENGVSYTLGTWSQYILVFNAM